MIIRINGLPLCSGPMTDNASCEHIPTVMELVRPVDHFLEQAMSATPATKYAHDWVTGVVDEGVHPIVEVGKAVGWAVGKGLWNLADQAGYVVYEAIPSGLHSYVHTIITETVKNCTAGTGCL